MGKREVLHLWQEENTRDGRNRVYRDNFTFIRDVFIEAARDKYKDIVVDTAICSLGDSIDPLILFAAFCKPKKVYLLYTDKTKSNLNETKDRLKSELGIFSYGIHISSFDVVNNYEVLNKTLKNFDSLENVAFDITAGTKIMSASIVLAANILSLNVFYIKSRFDEEHRVNEPFSEELVLNEVP